MKKHFHAALSLLAAVSVGLLILAAGIGIGYGVGWKHALMAVSECQIRGRR